jgi:15-cis-phytoene synthase
LRPRTSIDVASRARRPLAEAVVASARAGEPDRYLAALLAPAPVRPKLMILAAFSSELRRAATLVREPAMGELRLQWWREALAQGATARTGNPIADALCDLVREEALPPLLISELIDARSRDLAPEPVGDDAELNAYLWKSEGVAFLLAAQVLGGRSQGAVAAAAAAARAYGLVRLLQGLPRALARRRLLLPRTYLEAVGLDPQALLAGTGGARLLGLLGELFADVRRHLAAGRQHVAKLPRAVRPAFLPLALVAAYVRRLERAGGDIVREEAGIAPLARVARMAAAHWFGRM